MKSKFPPVGILLVLVLALGGLVQAFPGGEKNGLFHSLGDPYPRIVHQVFYHVEKKYVAPERASPRKLVEGALRALETQYPQVIVDLHEEKGTAMVRVDTVGKTFDLNPADRFSSAADVLNTVLTFVSANLGGDVEKTRPLLFRPQRRPRRPGSPLQRPQPEALQGVHDRDAGEFRRDRLRLRHPGRGHDHHHPHRRHAGRPGGSSQRRPHPLHRRRTDHQHARGRGRQQDEGRAGHPGDPDDRPGALARAPAADLHP